MRCPHCNNHYDSRVLCPACGTPLVDDAPQGAAPGISLNFGDANAVSGGVHVTDARVDNSVHNTVNNTTNNVTQTINNTTIHEAQKTREELEQDNENRFVQAVQGFMADGRLDQGELQQLNLLAAQYRITPQRADQLIDLVRRSAQAARGAESTEFVARQLVEEVYGAINAGRTDVLVRLMPRLEQLARSSDNDVVQFYHHLLLASMKPESAVMGLLSARTDNYWQLFWTHVAYVKLRQPENAGGLLPRMGVFGAPQGDMMLLMAIGALAQYRGNPLQDYYMMQAQDKLMQAQQYGMSKPLNALWYAVKEAMMEQPAPEPWFRFYAENTLKELYPKVAAGIAGMSAPGMPPMPQFGAQGVNLPQMQGFNPLQAVQQMDSGGMPSMDEMQRQLEAMRGGTPPPLPKK